jgi:transcriptional regulator with XRE-family HTH domain
MTDRAAVPWRVELGRRLRYERDARGWSRPQLAARLRSAPGDDHPPEVRQLADMVKQWERGLHAPNDEYQRRYCHVFGMDVRVLFAELHVPPSPWLVGGTGDVDREYLDSVTVCGGSRVDAGVVGALGLVLAGQRRLEDLAGASALLDPVTGQLSVVEGLLSAARGDGRDDVVRMGAQWAQFAAWLHEATGRNDAAVRLYDRALRWAVEVDDTSMVSTALNMQGHVAWSAGRVGQMLSLSRAAQRDRRASPRVRAIAAQQEARGLAITGDGEGTRRKLDEAIALADVAGSSPDDEPPWTYFHGVGHLTLQRGLAYRLLGRRYELDGDHVAAGRWYQRAGELFEAGLNELPADLRGAEWVGRYVRELRELSGDGE